MDGRMGEVQKDGDCCDLDAEEHAKLVVWVEETERLLKAKVVRIECEIFSYEQRNWCTNHLDMFETLAR
jgi:hypothetical protein